jgi:RNA methyltransferase, TrmH family
MRAAHRVITSLQNDQVKDLVRLRNRRERNKMGLTIIEEPLVIRRALDAGYPMQTVFFCEDHLTEANADLLADLIAITEDMDNNCLLVEFTAPVMEKVSYRDKSEGLLVVAPQIHHDFTGLKSILEKKQSRNLENPLLVILENVEKPGNLGAVLRIADGAGADAVIVCGQGTDLFNPNVLRASRGAFFSTVTMVAEIEEVQDFLKEMGITSVATSPAADNSWHEVDLTHPMAVILGAEHDGLSQQWLRAATLTVGIPMLGRGDSLNVSTSAAILLYEAVRQRQANQTPPQAQRES